jgi:hypothetical protein
MLHSADDGIVRNFYDVRMRYLRHLC